MRLTPFALTSQLIHFWRLSDHARKIKEHGTASAYRQATVNTIKYAKIVNHEALSRFLRTYGPSGTGGSIPYPWEGMGGLEQ